MNEETPEFVPQSLDPLVVVKEALAAHADRLVPGAVDELAKLWAPQVDTLDASVIKEVIAYRLEEQKWSGFIRVAPAPVAAAPTDAASIAAAQNAAFGAAYRERLRAAKAADGIGHTQTTFSVAGVAAVPSNPAGDPNQAFSASYLKAKQDARERGRY